MCNSELSLYEQVLIIVWQILAAAYPVLLVITLAGKGYLFKYNLLAPGGELRGDPFDGLYDEFTDSSNKPLMRAFAFLGFIILSTLVYILLALVAGMVWPAIILLTILTLIFKKIG